jgi:hypothetical protein
MLTVVEGEDHLTTTYRDLNSRTQPSITMLRLNITMWTKEGRAEGMPTREADARHKRNSVVL